MKKLSQVIAVALGFSMLVVCVSLTLNHPAAAAAGPGVTISGPLPIPVAGTVSINNFPAIQPVSGTVSVANFPASQPTSVSNNSVAPLYVRDVDGSAHHPFVMEATCTIAPSTTSCAGSTPSVTPNSKEFVIETISGVAVVDKGLDASVNAIVMTNGTLHSFRLPLVHSLSPVTADEFVTASPNFRVYSDGGQILEISFARSASPSTAATADVVFSGYTVDCSVTSSGCPLP